ncbi:hypothetical protein [Mesorhizobium sanjuanii]|uniref:hypothetical protein n=1 Tax=Mesorhizobium sanjuanii TaxID=2037900 RepID=UPI002477D0B7|nr:hypothetical protein [Mesorhizobium sanjuanii]
MLDLLHPIYRKTATYGYFGREEPEFTWERTDRADDLLREAGPQLRERRWIKRMRQPFSTR